MKNSCSIFLGICSLFFLAARVIASPLDGDKSSARRTETEPTVVSFPGIYYTDASQNDAQTEEMVNFVAEIDFQGAQNVGADTYRVSYLVHTLEEYERIDAINPYVNMNVDKEKTANLQAYVNTPSVADQASNTIDGYPCYRNVDGMFNFMDELVVTASDIDNLVVEKIDIGDSWEKTINSSDGDDIFAIKITGEGVAANLLSTEKGIVFITCGVHAREYAPPELCARWLEALVEGYGNDADVTSILDHTEIHIVLESNPDGRRIAETNRPLYWRKNARNGCSSSNNRGVDLNRNFPFKWGYPGGSSSDQCAPTYKGSGPASEPEVEAITEYAKSVFPVGQRQDDPEDADLDVPYPEDTTVGVFLDIHAYGNLLIWPYSYEERYCPNEEGHNAFARKLKNYNGYTLAGPFTPAFLYPAAGVTDEWFHKVLGAAGFTYELGNTFYQDCTTFEDAIFPDNIPGFMYLAKVSSKPYSLVKGPDVLELDVFPTSIDYLTTQTVSLSATVSDDSLSAGPGNYAPSTQNIASITYSFDMHPYDIDSLGNGPVLGLLPVTSSSTTVSSSEVLTVSEIIDHLQGPTNGKHTIYMYATDVDGYDGPVTAESFLLLNLPGGGPNPTNPPTAASSAPSQCTGPEFSLDLRTDDYGTETSWTLTDLETNDVVLSGDNYASSSDYEISECLNGDCYRFTIFDSYGDGICCSYGEGSYIVSVDGQEVVSGGDFGYSESVEFCGLQCDDSPLPISYGGSSYDCASLESLCSSEIYGNVVSSHCPVTCSACSEYACEDSLAPWSAGGDVYTCAQLASISQVEETCNDYSNVATTCPGTCGICA